MRGGTSRGVFTTADRLAAFADRDAVIRRLMGSPHPAQIDGLGGSQAVSSKFVVVGRSQRPDADVSYQVAQVGVDDDSVDWSGTCGNLTAAVGPYALETGLVPAPAQQGRVSLRLHNLSTGDIIRASFDVVDGRYRPEGDTAIDGVAGTGAEILTDYLAPVGGTLGRLYPLGQALSATEHEGASVEFTLVDVTHPYLFVDGRRYAADPRRPYAELLAQGELQARLEALRLRVGRLLDIRDDQRASVPRIIACCPDEDADLRILALSGGAFIPTIPVSGALALAAAARLPGTLVSAMARAGSASTARAARAPVRCAGRRWCRAWTSCTAPRMAARRGEGCRPSRWSGDPATRAMRRRSSSSRMSTS